MFDCRAEALTNHPIRRSSACLAPSGYIRTTQLCMEEETISSLARHESGLFYGVPELIGVGPKTAVAPRPAIGDVDIPPEDQRIRYRVVDFQFNGFDIARIQPCLDTALVRVPISDKL